MEDDERTINPLEGTPQVQTWYGHQLQAVEIEKNDTNICEGFTHMWFGYLEKNETPSIWEKVTKAAKIHSIELY